MRHNVSGRAFGRTSNQRKALLRGLATAVIENERIETTVAKAKETRRIVEKLVTLGKRGDLNSKRIAMSKVPNRRIIQKLFDEIAPRFTDRNGGYMRVVHTRQRVNDRAEMAVLEFVDYEETRNKAESAAEKKAVKPEKKAAPEKAVDAEAGEKKAPAKKKAAPKKAADTEAGEKKAPAKKKAAPKKAAPKKAADAEGAEKKAPAKKKAAPKKAADADKE